MQKSFKSLMAVSLTVTLCACCTSKNGNAQSLGDVIDSLYNTVLNETVAEPPAPPAPDTLTIYWGGDLMQHKPQIDAAYKLGGNKTYDYSECFKRVSPLIESADIAIGNLEVTLGGAPYTGYPTFSAPDEYAKAIRDAGFDILTTCNNHSCDRRKIGITRTLDVLDSLKVPHFGTYRSQSERDRDYPFVIEKNGIRLALLTYTYATNGIPIPQGTIVNMIDTLQMAKDIRAAKAKKPDVIIAAMHWGLEYNRVPEKATVNLTEWLFRHGVDHVIGGHPHVIQPMEVHTDKTGNKHLRVYSLGNYISNQSKPNTDGGASVMLQFVKKEGKTFLNDCNYTFHWVSRPLHNGQGKYILYPADWDQQQMTQTERTAFNNFLESSRDLYAKYNKGIQEMKK